jgi:hypothetical protein
VIGENGNAAFGHGLDAFLEVFGLLQPHLFGELVLCRRKHAIGDVAAQGGAGGDKPERRVFGESMVLGYF